jgi:[ribosomal protein S5]-alanine N-acetyltransferase
MVNRNFAPFPVLTTERLTLRQLAINDEQGIFTLRSDIEINKYLDRQVSLTIDDAKNFIEKITASESFYWAITFSEKDVLVGTVCLFNFSEDNYKCEIGFELLTNFQGQGVGKEAVEKVIEYALNMIEVRIIEAIVHKDNLSSIKLLQGLSFRNINELNKSNPDLLCYQLSD